MSGARLSIKQDGTGFRPEPTVALMTHLLNAGPMFRLATRMTTLGVGVASVNDWGLVLG